MQSYEGMAQGCGQEPSEVPASTIQRTASLAVSEGTGRRSCVGLREGQQHMVLFLRKDHQGE